MSMHNSMFIRKSFSKGFSLYRGNCMCTLTTKCDSNPQGRKIQFTGPYRVFEKMTSEHHEPCLTFKWLIWKYIIFVSLFVYFRRKGGPATTIWKWLVGIHVDCICPPPPTSTHTQNKTYQITNKQTNHI